MNPDDAAQIDEVASLWLARRYSGTWAQSDQTEFERWLNASTCHRVAYLRFERGWERTARLKALALGASQAMPPPPGRWNLSPFFQRVPLARRPGRWIGALAVAAALAMAVGIGFFVDDSSRARGSTYSTPVGGLATVPMTDGSHIVLNTNTAVRVAMSETSRKVELDHGEAFFDVAKDPARPFVVEAARQRIIVLGTQFSVRRDGDDVRVLVTAGQVRVEDKTGTTPPTDAIGPGTVVNAKGQGLLLQKQGLGDMQDALSWRTGFLVFRDATLAEAIDEFNRYSAKQIVIDDPKVAALRIAGSFPAANVEAFLRLLEKGYPLHVNQAEATIVLKGEQK